MLKYHTISYDIRARVFWALVGLSLASLFIYVYAVLATVGHTVSREALVKESSALATRVSELEFKDIALKNKVNLEVALAQGFSEVKSPLYVSRSHTALTLNLTTR